MLGISRLQWLAIGTLAVGLALAIYGTWQAGIPLHPVPAAVEAPVAAEPVVVPPVVAAPVKPAAQVAPVVKRRVVKAPAAVPLVVAEPLPLIPAPVASAPVPDYQLPEPPVPAERPRSKARALLDSINTDYGAPQ
jgi:hypothetical protein